MASPSRLPVFPTLMLALRFVWDGRLGFWYTAFLPVLVLTVLNTLGAAMAVPADPANPEAGSYAPPFIVVLANLALLALYVMFAVAWHRRWLMPNESVTYATALRWDGRKTKFLVRLFLIAACAFAVMLPIFLFFQLIGLGAGPAGAIGPGTVFGAVLMVLCGYAVMGRLMPLLPAAAVDDSLDFRGCWAMTTGVTGRLMLIVLLPGLIFGALNLAAEAVIDALVSRTGLGGSLVAVAIEGFALQIVAFFGIAVGVTALSISYQSLKQTLPAPPD